MIILEGEKMSSYEEPKDFYDIDSYDAKHKIKVGCTPLYDLAKFQYFYKNQADVGIEIVPCYYLHKEMSTEGSLMANNLFTILY